MWHFDTKKFRPNEVKRVKISLACVCAFMAVGWPLIVYQTGFMGWIKFWLMPWLGYHFWVCIDSFFVSNALCINSLSISTASVHKCIYESWAVLNLLEFEIVRKVMTSRTKRNICHVNLIVVVEIRKKWGQKTLAYQRVTNVIINMDEYVGVWSSDTRRSPYLCSPHSNHWTNRGQGKILMEYMSCPLTSIKKFQGDKAREHGSYTYGDTAWFRYDLLFNFWGLDMFTSNIVG